MPPVPDSTQIAADFNAALDAHPEIRRVASSTIRAYSAHLRRTLLTIRGDHHDPLFPHPLAFFAFLQAMPPQSRTAVAGAVVKWMQIRPNGNDPHTIQRALAILNKSYQQRAAMHADPNEPTDRQINNHVSVPELQSVLNTRKNELKREGVLYGSGVLPTPLYNKLRLWVAGCLYIADPDNLPRRLEYRSCRILSADQFHLLPEHVRNADNFLIIHSRNHKQFVLNDYKTASTYGTFRTRVGSILNSVLNVWLKYHRGEYLLSNTEPLTQQQMTALLQECFVPTGKLVSVNSLRHAVLTQRFPADLAERQRAARLMGHSVEQGAAYVLRLPPQNTNA